MPPVLRSLAICLAVLAAVAWPRDGAAEGALAVGLPGDVAKEGVAFGWVINSDSEGTAHERALRGCLDFKDAPATTRVLCLTLPARSLPLRRTSHFTVKTGARATIWNDPFPPRRTSASPVQPESVRSAAPSMIGRKARVPTLRPESVIPSVRSRKAPPRVMVSMTVAEAFFNVQQARGRLSGVEDALAKGQELVKRVEALGKGLTPPIEADRVRVLLAELEQAAASAREEWRVASVSLTQALRLNPSAVAKPIASPANVRIIPRLITSFRTSVFCAPNAMRMPISCVRFEIE